MGTSIPAHYEFTHKDLTTTLFVNDIRYKWDGVRSVPYIKESFTSSNRSSREHSYKLVSKSSNVTPNWFVLIKTSGVLPCNGFSRVGNTTTNCWGFKRTTVHQSGFIHYIETQIGTFGFRYENYVEQIALPTSKAFSDLEDEVRTKIRLAIKDQSVNIAQIIAERDKTISSVSKIITTVASVLLKLRKGDLAGAGAAVGQHVGWKKRKAHSRHHTSDPAGAAASAWLELQYAIMPLLMDAEGLAIALAKYEYQSVTGRVQASRSINFQTKDVSGSINSPSGQVTDITNGTVSIKYVVFFRVNSPQMPNFSALGLTNPAQLAWELVPFSFVLDWLLPIGNWLSTWDATVGMSFSAGTRSVKIDAKRERRVVKNYTPSPDVRDEMELIASHEINSVDRSVLSEFPTVALPTFKNPMSLKHLATSMALLYKALR